MDKDEFAELVRKTVEEGGILALMYFDMHSDSPDKLKSIMTEFVTKISVEEGVVYSFGNIHPAIEAEKNLYSTVAEVYVLSKDFYTLAYLSLNNAPVSIDILKPEKNITLNVSEAQNICARLSHFSQIFTSTYLTKVLSPEQKQEFMKKLKFREDLGRKMLDENKNKGDK